MPCRSLPARWPPHYLHVWKIRRDLVDPCVRFEDDDNRFARHGLILNRLQRLPYERLLRIGHTGHDRCNVSTHIGILSRREVVFLIWTTTYALVTAPQVIGEAQRQRNQGEGGIGKTGSWKDGRAGNVEAGYAENLAKEARRG